MTYSELKDMRQAKYEELHEKVELFWAFGQDQFTEAKAKHPLEEGCKYLSIGAGGFIPGQYKKQFIDGMSEIDKWEKQASAELRANRDEQEKAILYELKNHECFYTGEIDDVVDLFKDTYTVTEIKKVYRKYAKYQEL